MGVLLYPSGITEMYEPKGHTYTDEEIIIIFKDFNNIQTARLYEVPNTWVVWGVNNKPDDSMFNRIASDILQCNICSHVMFIHDTQINPDWNLTDSIIYKNYDAFKNDLFNFFEYITNNIIQSTKKVDDQGDEINYVNLLHSGETQDKRAIFEFDPNKQNEGFYDNKYYVNFADKIKDFILNFKTQKVFYIFVDNKCLIFVKNKNVETFINNMLTFYNKNEKYEISQQIKDKYEEWKIKNANKPSSKTRRKVNNEK